MRYQKFFETCKALGIEESELYISKNVSFSVSLFHGEIDNYSDSTSYSILARGIYKGKMGTAACDVWDKNKAKYLAEEIKNNAKVIENNDPVFIFGGSKKYHKINTFNRELPLINKKIKIQNLFDLERKIKDGDKRIIEVESVSYDESLSELLLLNSNGLKLKEKTNYFFYYGGALAKHNEETKSGGDFYLGNDFSQLNIDDLAKQIVNNTCEKLNGVVCTTATYPVVLDSEVVSSFIEALISNASAEEVQKHSSLLEGKLNQKIVSSKVTIEDKPLARNIFAKWFDDEGVATFNKPIIKNGKLMTYLYNLSLAKKDNVETTGNAGRSASKMSVCHYFLHMKPGKKSKADLFKGIENGIFINEVQGLHAGLNPQTGNFSLQAGGFIIKEGKKDKPLDMVTVSGNILKLFNDVKAVGSDYKVFINGVGCPSLLIKKLQISGK